MNVVDAFTSQVGPYLGSAPYGTAVGAPVQALAAAPGMPEPSAPTPAYWYPLPAGNPGGLTVAQVVSQAYGLVPVRDGAQIQQMAAAVAQENGLWANYPIPPNVAGLNLPWPPAQSAASPIAGAPMMGQVIAQPYNTPEQVAPQSYGPSYPPAASPAYSSMTPQSYAPVPQGLESPYGPSGPMAPQSYGMPAGPEAPGMPPPSQPASSGFSFSNLLAGLGAAAAGVGRIIMRHKGLIPADPYGTLGTVMPGQTGVGSPLTGSSNRAAMITSDIADGVPAVAGLIEAFKGAPAYGAYPQAPYAYPQPLPTTGYSPLATAPTYAPVPATPYGPSYAPAPAYGSTYAAASSPVGAIANGIGSLASAIGSLFS